MMKLRSSIFNSTGKKVIKMQQPAPMFPVMPSFPPTTEQIQKYLDENKKLILAILDNQNLGKLAECAQYQAQLQKNLMYLAAIADAQPQTPTTMPSQMTSPHPAMQQGGYYMQQQPQAAAAAAAMGGIFSPFNNPHHQLQDPQSQIMTMRPNNVMNSNNDTTTNTNNIGGGNDTRGGGNKQDKAAVDAQ